MSENLKVFVYVDRSAAILAGKSQYGAVEMSLTDEMIGQLAPEERLELANTPAPGYSNSPERMRFGAGGGEWRPGNERISAPDPVLSEATLESLRECLRARLSKRPVLEAEAKAEQEKKAAEREAEIQKILAAGVEALMIDRGYGDIEGRRWDFRYSFEDDQRVKPLVIEARDLAQKRNAGAKKAAFEAQAKREAEGKAHREACKATERDMLQKHGTESQRERHAADVLPEDELLRVARGVLFAPLAEFPRYRKIEFRDIEHGDDCMADADMTTFHDDDAVSLDEGLTEGQWKALKAIEKAAPAGAVVSPRNRWLKCKGCDETATSIAARVTIQWAGRDLVHYYDLGE